MWAKISDLNGNFLRQTKEFIDFSWEAKGLLGSYGDLFITNSATPGIPFIQLSKKVAYHDGFLSIKCNENVIIKKYLFYKLILDRPKLIKMGNGAIFINLSSEILKNWKIEVPSIKIQNQIIGIIERNEKLFLKYSNCVRIDNLNNVQTDMKNLIGIIEPIDLIKNNLLIIKKKIISFINKLQIKKTNERNIFNSITTGKLNANAAINDGRFNFYTCGEKILKTNNSSFCGRNIILSGNGELFTWIYDGIFDAYQRVYVLKERRDFYTTFYSLNKELNNLRKRSNGAVIKFIKKEDIFSIEKYSNSHEYILKQLYTFLLKIDVVEEKINKLQKKMILLLIK